MKSVTLLTSIEYPSYLANRIHILSMCDAFLSHGVRTELLCMQVEADVEYDITEMGLKRNVVQMAWTAAGHCRKTGVKVVYSREPRLLFFFILFSFFQLYTPRYIFEVHDAARSRLDAALMFVCMHVAEIVVVLNKHLRDHVSKFFLVRTKKMLVLPDAVDLGEYHTVKFDQQGLKCRLGIDNDFPIIMYTGSFAAWKGVFLLIDVAKRNNDLNFVFVGGREEQINGLQKYSGSAKNVFFAGHVNHKEIPSYQSAASVLVLPNTDEIKVSVLYTSPLKLFEYLASGKPIVASNLPSITEILTHNQNCLLFKSGDVGDLERKITSISKDPKKARELGRQGRRDSNKYTWENRTQSIIEKFNESQSLDC